MTKFNSIEAQTIKTNGRVDRLENSYSDMRDFKNQAIGGIGIIMAMVVPMFIWFLSNYVINK